MKSELLESLYKQFGVRDLSTRQHGTISDMLGDIYEQYILEIFKGFKEMIFYSDPELYPQESKIVNEVLRALNLDIGNILDVRSSNDNLGRTKAGGPPKTDAYIIFNLYNNEEKLVALNIKHSSQKVVSIAEYDVNTICESIGIPNGNLKYLMHKHQEERSAKNFTKEEKQQLTELIKPHREKLIRWCITLSPNKQNGNIQYPDLLIRFIVKKLEYIDVQVMSVDEYITYIISKGDSPRKTGFGTGLNWTYATGSRSNKIQFKG